MFPLSRAIDRGDLRSAGISRFIAKPLRSYRSPSLASASFDRLLLCRSAILGYYPSDPECFTKILWVIFRCSPGYSIVVVKLDAVCDPGVSVGTRHERTFRFACAYDQGIGTFPKFTILGAKGQIQGIHPSPRLTRVASNLNLLGRYTTGRLTGPYPGGLMHSHFPLNVEPVPGSNDHYC